MATADIISTMRSNYTPCSLPLYDRPSLAQNLRRKSTMIARKYLQTPDRPRPRSTFNCSLDMEPYTYDSRNYDLIALNDPEPDNYTSHFRTSQANYMRRPFERTVEVLPPPLRAECRYRAMEKRKFDDYVRRIDRKYNQNAPNQKSLYDNCTRPYVESTRQCMEIKPSVCKPVTEMEVDEAPAYRGLVRSPSSPNFIMSSLKEKEPPRLPAPEIAPCRYLKPMSPMPSAPPERFRTNNGGLGSACSARELSQLITDPSGGSYVIPVHPYDEVYPGILIGDMATALCTQGLLAMGVTHVLNAAQKDPRPGVQAPGYYVNTNYLYYKRANIEFLGVPATDAIEFDLSQFFELAADFIDRALDNDGKVLVHCHQGISRSATLVLAFLMLKRGMSAQEALKTVRAKREIIPNTSFLRQLCDLNDRLLYSKRSRYPRYT